LTGTNQISLRLEKVSKNLTTGRFSKMSHLSFREVNCYYRQNGSGKSTLVKIISGLLAKPQEIFH
jgi:ABC-type sugar transport system ATPase subunit